MIYTIALLISSIAWYAKTRHTDLIILKTKFKLFAIRDLLREKAILGEIDSDDWLFDYLDHSISNIISELNSLNIYYCIGLYFLHKNDNKYIEFSKKVKESLNGKDELKIIYSKLGEEITDFMKQRHITLFNSVRFLFISISGPILFYKGVRDTFAKSSEGVLLYPETAKPNFA